MKRILMLLFFTIWAGSFVCESQAVNDTLNRAKTLQGKGEIHKAYVLLKILQAHHPNDLGLAWYTAQTAYLAHRPGKSKKLYEAAIAAHRENLFLQLDYARTLVELGEFSKAKPMLDAYLKYDSTNAKALTAMAKILYWQSEYREAMKKINAAVHSDPENSEASGLRKEIALAAAPSITIGAGYNSDDQPQQQITPLLSGSLYLHPLSTLHVNFQDPVILQESKSFTAQQFSFGNQMVVSKANMVIDLDAGLVKLPYKNTLNWMGSAVISKTFTQHLILTLLAARNAYFSTLSSVDTLVMQHHYSFSVEWNNDNSWNGKAALDLFNYSPDHNACYGGYAWIFAPPVRFGSFLLHLGYAYSYSNSDKNHFIAADPSAILANPDYTAKVTGVYDPYFTPSDQQIHAALLVFKGRIFKWMDLNLNANAGFYALMKSPYLYLDRDKTNTTFIAKGFLNTNYHPVSVSIILLAKLSALIHLQAEYRYTSTYFFTSNYAGVGLNIRLMNEQKKKR